MAGGRPTTLISSGSRTGRQQRSERLACQADYAHLTAPHHSYRFGWRALAVVLVGGGDAVIPGTREFAPGEIEAVVAERGGVGGNVSQEGLRPRCKAGAITAVDPVPECTRGWEPREGLILSGRGVRARGDARPPGGGGD